MIDWSEAVNYLTKIRYHRTTDIFPGTPPISQRTVQEWFYTPNHRLVSASGRNTEITIEVIDMYACDSIKLDAGEGGRFTIIGWGEFDANDTPRLADVVVRRNSSRASGVHVSRLGEPTNSIISNEARLLSYLGKTNSETTLLILVKAIRYKRITYIEIEWNGKRLTPSYYHVQSTGNNNHYRLSQLGYLHLMYHPSSKSITLNHGELLLDKANELFSATAVGQFLNILYSKDGTILYTAIHWGPDGTIHTYEYDRQTSAFFERNFIIYTHDDNIVAHDATVDRDVQTWDKIDGTILGYDNDLKLLLMHTKTANGERIIGYREGKIVVLFSTKGTIMKYQWLYETKTIYLQHSKNGGETLAITLIV